MIRALLCLAAWIGLTVAGFAQTVSPSFFGMNYGNLDPTISANYPIGTYSNYRVWNTHYGATSSVCEWSVMNPASLSYSWTGCDALVAQAAANGTKLTLTIGSVPAWVNSSQSLPTAAEKQDLYTFLSALLAHEGCNAFAYVEDWNEFNYGSGWYAGTDADMITISAGEYSAIHAACPGIVVLSPSVSGASGEASGLTTPSAAAYHWDTLLKGCAALAPSKCFDVLNIHSYVSPISVPIANNATSWAPELEDAWLRVAQAIAVQDGFGSLPFWIDEGYAGPTSGVTAPWSNVFSGDQAINYLIISSNGVAAYDWWSWGANPATNPNAIGTINGVNATGQVLASMQSWLKNNTWSGPFARSPGANAVRQQGDGSGAAIGLVEGPGGCAGGASGTGSFPSDWSVSWAQSGAGVSTYVQAIDSVNHTEDVMLCGTDSTSGSGTNVETLTFDTVGAPTVQGANWVLGLCLQLVGGNLANIQQIALMEQEYQSDDATSNGVASDYSLYPISTKICRSFRQTMAYASTAFVRPRLQITHFYNSATLPLNLTIRISAVTLDQGFQWTGFLTGPNGYGAEVAEDAAGSGSTIVAPAGSVDYRDPWGNVFPTSGGATIHLQQWPYLIEN